GNAFVITGINTLPPRWGVGECPDVDDSSNLDDVVGIRSAANTGVASTDLDNVYGYPAKYVDNDPGITNATFQNYLDYTYATLASQPNVKVYTDNTPYSPQPSVDNTTSPPSCLKSDLLNLGEPFRNPPLGGETIIQQCYGYFPVVHGTADRTKFAAGARGQGTLLVDGDMELAGGFEWDGLIIVKGSIKINGNGNKLTGAVFAQGVDLVTAGSVSGNVEIKYSQCAVSKAVGGATLAAPVGQRSFLHLY
ncbi:MAG TPA: hypothetical protein VFU23_16540, partial [Gemmatimonadales bacterium]|nr:hypothetical protein [Gemmatimonadales bacterium]